MAFLTPKDRVEGTFEPSTSFTKAALKAERSRCAEYLLKEVPMKNIDGVPRTHRDWNRAVGQKLQYMKKQYQNHGRNTELVRLIQKNEKVLLAKSLEDARYLQTASDRGVYEEPLPNNVPGVRVPPPAMASTTSESINEHDVPPVPPGTRTPYSENGLPRTSVMFEHMKQNVATGGSHVRTPFRDTTNMQDGGGGGASNLDGASARLSKEPPPMRKDPPMNEYEAQRLRNVERRHNVWNKVATAPEGGNTLFLPHATAAFLAQVPDDAIITAFNVVSKTRLATFTFGSLGGELKWNASEMTPTDVKRINANLKERWRKSHAMQAASVEGERLGEERKATKAAKAANKTSSKTARNRGGGGAGGEDTTRSALPRKAGRVGERKRRTVSKEQDGAADDEAEEEGQVMAREVVTEGRQKAMAVWKLSKRLVTAAKKETKELQAHLSECTHTIWGSKPEFTVWDVNEEEEKAVTNLRIGALCRVEFEVGSESGVPFVGLLVGIATGADDEADADDALNERVQLVVEFSSMHNDFAYIVFNVKDMLRMHKLQIFKDVYVDEEYTLKTNSGIPVYSKTSFMKAVNDGKASVETLFGEWAGEGRDVTACVHCGKTDGEEQMLMCDGCDKGSHMSCISPPLSAMPEGSWHCSTCG